MKNYFRAWPGALGGIHIVNDSREINLQSKAQFKSKIFQRKIDLNTPDLIELTERLRSSSILEKVFRILEDF